MPQQPSKSGAGNRDQSVSDAAQKRPANASTSLDNLKDIELYVFEEDKTDNSYALPLADVSSLDVELDKPERDAKQQVSLRSEQGRLLLLLPPSSTNRLDPAEWAILREEITLHLNSGNRFWQPNTAVHLMVGDRLLDSRQLQDIDELLQSAQLCMKCVCTQRRQTAVAAVTTGYSVEQMTQLEHLTEYQNPGKALDPPLYLQMTIRSGTEIRHPGSIVVLGDVNPGGSLVAEGDIFVWGRLRGVAHAGAEGNTTSRIMALHMQPTQLRIADKVARAPEKPPSLYQPEVAYINNGSIRIAIASEFAQVYLNVS